MDRRLGYSSKRPPRRGCWSWHPRQRRGQGHAARVRGPTTWSGTRTCPVLVASRVNPPSRAPRRPARPHLAWYEAIVGRHGRTEWGTVQEPQAESTRSPGTEEILQMTDAQALRPVVVWRRWNSRFAPRRDCRRPPGRRARNFAADRPRQPVARPQGAGRGGDPRSRPRVEEVLVEAADQGTRDGAGDRRVDPHRRR